MALRAVRAAIPAFLDPVYSKHASDCRVQPFQCLLVRQPHGKGPCHRRKRSAGLGYWVAGWREEQPASKTQRRKSTRSTPYTVRLILEIRVLIYFGERCAFIRAKRRLKAMTFYLPHAEAIKAHITLRPLGVTKV